MSSRCGETNNDLFREFIEFLPKEFGDRELWLEFEPRQILFSQGRMAERTLFPVSGLISCFRSLGHRRVEVHQVGPEGVLGLHAALTLSGGEETTTSISMTTVRMIGLPPRLVRLLVMDQPQLREISYQYLHHQELETNEVLARLAACSLTARLAFWILRAHQKLRHEPIPVTHEVL
jgi:CRP-like cAMP-binding protein